MKIKAVDFNLEATLDSGQVFGFTKNKDKNYQGRIAGYEIEISQMQDWLHINSTLPQQKLVRYFDLERNLNPVYELIHREEALRPLAKKLRGLRLIQQDPWEALACFILSSNNNVKRIQLIWRNLSDRLSSRKNQFPEALEIARVHERTLRELGLGYRAPYLLHTAQFISKNEISLQMIRQAPYEEAVERVIAFPGIGPKVADCVLLYGFQKYEAFPVDVWILRAMRRLYFKNRKISEEKIRQFARKRWGSLAGYVQQYIFHAARTGVISV